MAVFLETTATLEDLVRDESRTLKPWVHQAQSGREEPAPYRSTEAMRAVDVRGQTSGFGPIHQVPDVQPGQFF